MKTIPAQVRAALPAAVLSLAVAVPLAAAAPTAALTADEIMQKVDHAVRKSFTTQLASVKITTCKYMLVNGSAKCSERPRVVVAENAKKAEVVDGLYNYAQLSILREPISDKGASLLVYESGERGKDNDNWLYLPALAKVNRVIANDDEGGSVFGSEFSVETTENPEGRKTEDFTYRIVEETTYEGRPVWVIEMLPTPEKARRTAYGKVVAWVDKTTFLAVKEDLYRNGRVHKQRTQSEIKQVDGVYVAAKIVMNNWSTSRISQMDKMAMRHNAEIPDEFLTQRALTDFSFRERNLAKFRAELAK
jgi:hypothetical protein